MNGNPTAKEPCRQRFHEGWDSPEQARHADSILRMLLAQDGSTTRLCECLAGGAVSVRLLAQERTTELPARLASVLPGSIFMRRLIALEARGHVLMDSLSFIALEGLAQDMRHALEEGVTPIGHLLARLWTRRAFRGHDTQLFEQLWSQVGLADPAASRSYTVVTPKASLMVIAETFRRGLLVACQDSVPPRPGV